MIYLMRILIVLLMVVPLGECSPNGRVPPEQGPVETVVPGSPLPEATPQFYSEIPRSSDRSEIHAAVFLFSEQLSSSPDTPTCLESGSLFTVTAVVEFGGLLAEERRSFQWEAVPWSISIIQIEELESGLRIHLSPQKFVRKKAILRIYREIDAERGLLETYEVEFPLFWFEGMNRGRACFSLPPPQDFEVEW